MNVDHKDKVKRWKIAIQISEEVEILFQRV